MDIVNRNPKIYLLCGKARHGKDTIAGFLTDCYHEDNKKVIISRAGKYIRYYVSDITGWDGSEENKPRELLQQIGTEIIRKKLNKANMLLERQNDDILIYSYFCDCIIVPDIRLPEEIASIKSKFDNVVVIHVERINFESELTNLQSKHLTEVAMDNYDDYDYKLINDTLEQLKLDVKKIYEKEKKENE